MHERTTSMHPSNAGSFRRLAYTEPANDRGKEKQQQVKPLPTGRQAHCGCRRDDYSGPISATHSGRISASDSGAISATL